MSILDIHPHLVPPDIGSMCADLSDVYNEYTRDVSPNNMAVSLRTAVYFLYLCRALDARSVADFGSGFTSYIAGLYAQEVGGVDAASVDDNAEWLEKTRTFIEARQLKSDLMLWDDYKHTHTAHDVACYDLGNGEVRNAGMELVARRTKPGGVVLFDDAMHAGHRSEMERVAHKFRWDLFFLHEYTTDQYGRFAAVMIKP